MFDVGLKVIKDDKADNYRIDDVCFIYIDEENETAELLDKKEREIYPLFSRGYMEDVFIIPGQERLLDNVVDPNLSIHDKLNELKSKIKGADFSLNFNEVEDSIINIEDIDVKQISNNVKKAIIGQDNVVEKVISTIVSNQKLFESEAEDDEVRNARELMLIFGKTGTGKTEIIKQVASQINIPYVIEDATKFTDEAYKARNVSDMLLDLLRSVDGDIDLAERGILVIDEIDKKRSSSNDDASTVSVQNSLLKIMDGGIIQIEVDSRTGETIDFDTSFLTIILLGAFEGMLNKNERPTIGFNSESKANKITKVTTDDFVNYGMIPEFMGRISHVVKTNDLDYDALKNILIHSNLSPLNLKKKHLERLKVKYYFDDDFIDNIVRIALAKKTGARGLKSAVSDVFDSLDFNLDFEALSGDLNEIEFKKNRVRKK